MSVARVEAHVAAHLAGEADEHVLGWLVGARGADGEPVLLGAARCLHYAARAPRADAASLTCPDWAREGEALSALLPVGLSVVGYYASAALCAEPSEELLAATPAANAAAFFRAAPRGDVPWPTEPSSGALLVAIAAQPAAAGEATVTCGRVMLSGTPGWRACDAAALDSTAAQWLDCAACVRASCDVPLSIPSAPQPLWRGACAEAFESAERLLDGDACCFAVHGAPELGVLSFGADASAAPTVGDALGAGAAPPADAQGQQQHVARARSQLALELLWDVTPASAEGRACAPVLVTVPATRPQGPRVGARAQLQVAALCPASAALCATAGALRRALRAQLRRLLVGALGEAPDPLRLAAPAASLGASGAAGVDGPRLVGCAFEAPLGSACPPAFHAEYVLGAAPDSAEAEARAARAELHARLGLPTNRPLLRTSSALPRTGSASRSSASRLVNVHAHCPPSGVAGGMLAVVRGDYEYFHYMQVRRACTSCPLPQPRPERSRAWGWQKVHRWSRASSPPSAPQPAGQL